MTHRSVRSTAISHILGRDHDEIFHFARHATPGAEGVTLLTYFEGERTPSLPMARATIHGMSLANSNPRNLARAFVEGMFCGLVVGLDALIDSGVPVDRLFIIGRVSCNRTVQQVLAQTTPIPVLIPEPGEYVTVGAVMQAAAAVTGEFPDRPSNIRKLKSEAFIRRSWHSTSQRNRHSAIPFRSCRAIG
ncbi:MAG: FGGY-family carbohydrate kinase [Flaviflexus sp.]|uniref:FGGY-family carbohydrate kinase n=1 Tax=Flaviflexus sp. TaxID=1969482 RepID=UPI003F9359BD